jgi:eukaryotic-like serine/threonine-protein kinase
MADREVLTPTLTADGEGTAFADTVLGLAAEAGAGGHTGAELAVGATRFPVTRELGRGGMGVVYEADDLQFGRRVAVKGLTRDHAALRARFLTESVVTANLEHPGVAPVYERGFDDAGKPYYAMRLVRGRTLSEEVEAREGIERRLELLPAVVRVAQTLAFAHDNGVVHRDVKPDNVMIGKHGDTILLDWGIARVRGMPAMSMGDGADSQDLQTETTRAGAIVGTPAYMAPEQARGLTEEVDERTDVFALGALLYHVLSGRPPFKAEAGTDPLARARSADAPPLTDLAPKAPAALVVIVARAMERDPADRYQTAGELAEALERFIGRAVTGDESRGVKIFAALVAVLAFLVFGIGSAMIMTNVPSIAERGAQAYAYSLLFACGIALSLIEWRTRGRYRLASLTLALAAMTLFSGISGTFDGYTYVLRAAATANEVADTIELRRILVEGSYEAFGNIAPSVNFCALQIFAWALVARANERARDAAAQA